MWNKMEKKEKKAKKEKVPKEKGNFNPMLLLPIMLVLAVVGSVAGSVIMNKFFSPEKEVAAQKQSSTIEEGQQIVALNEFLVNLAKGKSGEQQYMKITISLLVDDKKTSEEVTTNVAVVRDAVVNLLRQKKADDILGSVDSVTKLKEELKLAINHNYGKDIVRQVYVTDFVIQ